MSTLTTKHHNDKAKILGQFFTKETTVEKLVNLLLKYKNYDKKIRILEPSFGTGNFIKVLNKIGFHNIDGCEIDEDLTKSPKDFFDYAIANKYDLIIGNPPFTKYNIKESYYSIKGRTNSHCHPEEYMPTKMLNKEKEKIENVFILKSLKHLKNENSTVAFVLPISFFIGGRNLAVKEELRKRFSTIIIFQNTEVWFDYNIPCCFGIFTNSENFQNKIILYYKNDEQHREELEISSFYGELIPQVFYNKKHGLTNNHHGDLLKNYLSSEKATYHHSFITNNVSGKNILEKDKIPIDENIEDYKLAVVRVGNASVGKCGLINIKKDVLNDMFYIFDFDQKYIADKAIKEKICESINKNREYFKNVTCRVGSKSIKKEDIFAFKVRF